MKYCPITYDPIADDAIYSMRGLHLLSPQLTNLHPLTLSAKEQRLEAIARVGKMSIQGVQSKISAQLKVKDSAFTIVDEFGTYILKPQSEFYLDLPQNEALTMSLAQEIGLEVPIHGLVQSSDQTWTYFIKRFDRHGHKQKLPIEDFAQLLQMRRETKYNSSMEQVAKAIQTFCSFPKIESVKLLKLTLFNFLIGNEDMHLKNFSLITRDKKTTLSPAYDLLNSSIALGQPAEELALPIRGKKKNLHKKDFFEYFALQHLKLNDIVIANVQKEISIKISRWRELIERSFMSEGMKKKYSDLLKERLARLGL